MKSCKKCQLRPAQAPMPSQAELQALRDKVVELVTKDPRKAAIVLTDWLKLPVGSKSESAKKKIA